MLFACASMATGTTWVREHYVESWSARTSGSGKPECPGCPTLAEMQVNAHKNLELETLKIWVQQGRDEERDFQ